MTSLPRDPAPDDSEAWAAAFPGGPPRPIESVPAGRDGAAALGWRALRVRPGALDGEVPASEVVMFEGRSPRPSAN